VTVKDQELLSLLGEGSALKSIFPTLESRPEQSAMLKDILDAFRHQKIAMIEAGTGCGKSMAYLIPALYYASHHNEKIVVSTHTINLQEQLLEKDIPLLLKGLNLSLKTVLVKGKHNYLCLRKFHEQMEVRMLAPENEVRELESIHDQLHDLQEGSKSELKVLPSYATWDRIHAESDTCNSIKCPYYKDCYFFKARKEVQDAQILIVNHHLLFADLALQAESKEGSASASILPPYDRLIIDEAHHIEEVATDYFSRKVGRLSLLKTVGTLLSDGAQGKVGQLKEKLLRHFSKGFPPEMISIFDRLSVDLPGGKKELLARLHEMFEAFLIFIEKGGLQEELKVRLRDHHASHPFWQEQVVPKTLAFIGEAGKIIASLWGLEEDLNALKDDRLDEFSAPLRHDIKALCNRLSNSADTLKKMLELNIPENQVRWIEHSGIGYRSNTTLTDANLDLSQLFADRLFSKIKTIILSSATLTTDQKFDFFASRFGLELPEIEKKVEKKLYLSPYNYREQAALCLPTDLPDPNDPNFISEASDFILKLLEVSQGGAFILFTSYAALKKCYALLEKPLKDRRLSLMKQGDASRKDLLAAFTKTRHGVLFGTDSFWEGVDVAGEKLRLVVIVKLPFKVPTEPLIQARIEKIKREGHDPFKAYSLPQAILKLKQGFGRLIRSKKDRGAIVILDGRLLTKGYGKNFLSSLPKCFEIKETQSIALQKLSDFFKQRHKGFSS
jgi:ATP-dependent DNA helicase DinG